MKAKHIILAISLCASVVVATMMLVPHRSPDAKNETSPDVITGNASNSAPPVTSAAEEAKGKTNAANEEGYIKTITDSQAGEYVVASPDKQSVVLKDKNGKIIWSTNITGWIKFPEDGSKEIWSILLVTNQTGSMERFNNTVVVRVGRGIVFVNTKTGEVIPGPIY